MKIYDISQELFGSVVFPGDRAPKRIVEKLISNGEKCNVTSLEMCAHNGTHIDSPFHFFIKGDTIEKIPLEKTVGNCYVTEQTSDIDGRAAKNILKTAENEDPESAKRILIKGKGVVTAEAAHVFADAGIYLIGGESQTTGPETQPTEVHKILLSEKIVLLEGIRLSEIEEGVYFLSAAPLLLGESDGAPCRAFLIQK